MTSEAHKLQATAGDELPADLGETGPGLAPALPRTGRYSSGSVIAGKYQLGQILGEGGMGSVWVARNRTLDVEVAIKLMRAELADDVDGIAERMLQEARAAASIGHPAIIQVYDFGFTELGDPFIAMELLRGESLAEAIRRRGKLNPVRGAQALLPIVDALAAAHRRKIVHRDLKPENIFLSRPGGQRLQPKVLDFGIAKLEQAAAERLTRDGAVIGSPAYMAPEQLRGDPNVDGRVDVWALGVVFYQMIAGARPFDGASYHASMWNIVNAEPRPLAEHGIEEPELWAIIQGALMKDPNARYADMRAFGRAIAKWLIARGVQEDVGNASLANWMEDEAPSSALAHSFFPSHLPLREAAPAPEPQSSGTRRILVDVPRVAATPRAASWAVLRPRGWKQAWIVLGAALVAFVGAALWSHRGTDEEADEPEAPARVARRPAQQRPAKPATNFEASEPRGLLSPLASALAPELAAVPQSTAAPSVPKRASSAKSGVRRPTQKSELKDPFQ